MATNMDLLTVHVEYQLPEGFDGHIPIRERFYRIPPMPYGFPTPSFSYMASDECYTTEPDDMRTLMDAMSRVSSDITRQLGAIAFAYGDAIERVEFGVRREASGLRAHFPPHAAFINQTLVVDLSIDRDRWYQRAERLAYEARSPKVSWDKKVMPLVSSGIIESALARIAKTPVVKPVRRMKFRKSEVDCKPTPDGENNVPHDKD